ncbi:hypothetical protein Q4Q35_20010 [Flavivirga aquimarina]|uniref:Uncharacterized protein n=1 Tax=Flavivirga aquimarina TaxID=2027862 RepID=A0ABT8WG03_9FLAO|nr:hypothetical protein [Flavivirga aquimarina]MDO5972092.1 hypothetical protein [Flavivirga aquimarina]
MKKLFIIALFAIGLTTTMQAQSICVNNYSYSGMGFTYDGSNGELNQFITIDNSTKKFTASISNLTCGVGLIQESLTYLYLMHGLNMYYGEVLLKGDTYAFTIGVYPPTGEIEEIDICKN